MELIHEAALEGKLVEVDRLVSVDRGLLNAPVEVFAQVGRTPIRCCAPLHLAALRGHDAVVARLLALGADWQMLGCFDNSAAHYACMGNHPSSLALLLDVGAQANVRNQATATPLVAAALHGATECVEMLLARGGKALELDAQTEDGYTALHYAASRARTDIIQTLVQAGADPTMRDRNGETPLDSAHSVRRTLLEAAIAEPQRPRALLKARALLDNAHKIRHILSGGDDGQRPQQGQGQGPAPRRKRTRAESQCKALAVTPAYFKGRVAKGRKLPRVEVVVAEGKDEVVVACVEYALEGMVWEVFVELCEMIIPKWDRKNVW
jgi:hypothetical protein